MTSLNKLILGAALLMTGVACNDGIDPISKVDAGPDTAEPTVVITKPTQNKINIPFTDVTTDLEIAFVVMDDIEIKNISLQLDGQEVESYSSFKDYRRANRTYLYDNLSIGTHTIDVVAEDLSGKAKTVSRTIEITNVYEPLEGEVLFMPFEGNANVDLVSLQPASVMGSPGFAEGKSGKAYAGAANSYLTFPIDEFAGEEFSAAFWYKLNSTPDRAGILTVSQPDPTHNNRNTGFRFFREQGGTFKLNVGTGTIDSWFDDGAKMVIPANSTDWLHIAFTISKTEVVVYFNGVEVKKGAFAGISWENCTTLSIGSGAPEFTEWNHLSDQSRIDDLRIFNKALTQEEINSIIGD